jgi:hypothetical protein
VCTWANRFCSSCTTNACAHACTRLCVRRATPCTAQGKLKVFLYQRGAETLRLLQAVARISSDSCSDTRGPPKIACAHLCMLLRPFGLDDLLPSRLAELRYARSRSCSTAVCVVAPSLPHAEFHNNWTSPSSLSPPSAHSPHVHPSTVPSG